MICKNCGAENEIDAKYCRNCGEIFNMIPNYYGGANKDDLDNFHNFAKLKRDHDYKLSSSLGGISLIINIFAGLYLSYLCFLSLGLSIYGLILACKVIKDGYPDTGARTLNIISLISSFLLCVIFIWQLIILL